MYSRIAFFAKDFFPYIIGIFAVIMLFVFFITFLLKSPFTPRAKKILIAIAFFVVSTVLVFSIMEGYFRYIYDESDGLGFLQVNKRWAQRHVVYNNLFKRDRDFKTEKPAGIIRIGMLGDSITFGQGIANPEDRFSNILQKNLQEGGINAEVYNLGVSGLDSHEEIKAYQDLSYLNFDIVVWQYYLNDIQPEDKSIPSKIISQNAYPIDLLRKLSEKSTFFDFLYWRFSSKYSTTFDQLDSHYTSMYGDETILNSHQKELSEFIGKLKDENKEIIVIIFPFIELLGPNYPATEAHSKLQSYFHSQDIETIDLLDDLKNSNWKDLIASRFDTHPNEKVHNLAAEKLYEKICPKLKQPK